MLAFPTETVEVLTPRTASTDSMGEPVVEWSAEQVPGVLFDPNPDVDRNLAADRPAGVSATAALYFPDDYAEPLRGRRIARRGVVYSVVGDPQPYCGAPGRWNRRVEAAMCDG